MDITVDGSFNSSLIGGQSTSVIALTLQADGRILIGGTFTVFVNESGSWNHSVQRRRFARLDSDGTLDHSFGMSPSYNTAPGGADEAVFAIALDGEGRALIGGDFTSVDGEPRHRVARLNEEGRLDTTFDPGSGLDDRVNAITVDHEGKVLLGGRFHRVNGEIRSKIARLNTKIFPLTVTPSPARAWRPGMLDLSFDAGPIDGRVRAVARQNDGKWIVAGAFTSIQGYPRGRVARLHSDGRLDPYIPGWSGRSRSDH